MVETILISGFILIAAVLLLGFRIFFIKNGKFPNTHIGKSKAMQERGISCATSQDRKAQSDQRRLSTSDIVNQVIESN